MFLEVIWKHWYLYFWCEMAMKDRKNKMGKCTAIFRSVKWSIVIMYPHIKAAESIKQVWHSKMPGCSLWTSPVLSYHKAVPTGWQADGSGGQPDHQCLDFQFPDRQAAAINVSCLIVCVCICVCGCVWVRERESEWERERESLTVNALHLFA